MMPARSDEPTRRALSAPAVAIVLVSYGVVGFLYLIRSILLPFVLAAIAAFVCAPLIEKLSGRSPRRRWLVAAAVLLALMALVAALGYVLIPVAKEQLLALLGDPQRTIAGFMKVLVGEHGIRFGGATLNANQVAAKAAAGMSEMVTNGERLFTVAAWGLSGLFKLVLTWVVLAYLLLDGPEAVHGLLWLVPPRRRPFVQELCQRATPILRRYFIGVALVVVYASAAAYLGLGYVLGLKHALFLALVTGVLELVPLIGPIASAVLAGLVAVRQATSPASIIEYIGYAIALRLSIDQFIGPIVLGRAAYVRPILVIACFLIGGVLLGVVGIVIAIPVALSIKIALTMRYEQAAVPDVRRAVS
jgi:predicted PurR-regulated permease PerM